MRGWWARGEVEKNNLVQKKKQKMQRKKTHSEQPTEIGAETIRRNAPRQSLTELPIMCGMGRDPNQLLLNLE